MPQRRASIRTATFALVVCGALLLAAAPARAQPVPVWRPSPHSLDLLTVEGVRVNRGFTPTAHAAYTVSAPADSDSRGWAERVRGTLDVMASVSLFDYLSLGVALPLALHGGGATGGAVGDLRAGLKGAILRPGTSGVGVGLSFEVFAPTASGSFLFAEQGVVFRPRLLLEAADRVLRAALNFGYVGRLEPSSVPVAKRNEYELLFAFDWSIDSDFDLLALLSTSFVDERLYQFDTALAYRQCIAPVDICYEIGVGIGGVDEARWRCFLSIGYMPRSDG